MTINRSETPIVFWEGAIVTPIVPPLYFEILSDGESILLDIREISYTSHRIDEVIKMTGSKTEYFVVEIVIKSKEKMIFAFSDTKLGVKFISDINELRKQLFSIEARRLHK